MMLVRVSMPGDGWMVRLWRRIRRPKVLPCAICDQPVGHAMANRAPMGRFLLQYAEYVQGEREHEDIDCRLSDVPSAECAALCATSSKDAPVTGE